MLELGLLLAIGYLGGCSGRIAWLFLLSGIALVGMPLYLAKQAGIDDLFLLSVLTILSVTALQTASLAGLLKAEPV